MTTTLLLIIGALLLWAAVQWALSLRRSTLLLREVRDLRHVVELLREALTEDADEDVMVSLREAKHFAEGSRHELQLTIEELYHQVGLSAPQWTDREEARRTFIERHKADLGQQGPGE